MASVERRVIVEGKEYTVLISDEEEALLAGKTAGRVFIGLPGEYRMHIPYMAESLEAIDDNYLEQVVRRKNGLPWIIGKNQRVTLREFVLKDFGELKKAMESGEDRFLEKEEAFTDREKFHAYIKNQYGFYQYGIWAVEKNTDKRVIGYGGIYNSTNGLELGYGIFKPWQRQGYAFEICGLILDYVKEEYACPLYARVEVGNLPSINLLKKLGFEKYSESIPGYREYVVNLK